MNDKFTSDVFRRLSNDPLTAEIMAEHVAELVANLKFQTFRADGATLAMQELQAELDRLKPWAELGKLAKEIQSLYGRTGKLKMLVRKAEQFIESVNIICGDNAEIRGDK